MNLKKGAVFFLFLFVKKFAEGLSPDKNAYLCPSKMGFMSVGHQGDHMNIKAEQ